MKESRRFQGVVFDMDGVMFDTERLTIDGWLRAGRETGFAITAEMMIETIGIDGKSSAGIFRRYLGDGFDPRAVRPRAKRHIEEYIAQNGLPLKPGLVELLGYLRAEGYETAVASSTRTPKVNEYLEAAKVAEYFRRVVGGDKIERGKPEPDIYLEACGLLGLSPGDCVAIEDSPAGLRSAHRAGLRVIMIPDLVPPGESVKDIPYALLGSLGEVPAFLENA